MQRWRLKGHSGSYQLERMLTFPRLVKQLAGAEDVSKILQLTGVLRTEFVFSTNANLRKVSAAIDNTLMD